QAKRDAGTDPPQPLRQADGTRRLAFSRPGRRDRGDDHQLTIGTARQPLQDLEADLRFERSVRDHLGLEQPELPANLHDRSETTGLDDVKRLCGLAHACIDPGGSINVERGLAASNSLTSAPATSSGEPARSPSSPQRQASRYASMPVDPSFIA